MNFVRQGELAVRRSLGRSRGREAQGTYREKRGISVVANRFHGISVSWSEEHTTGAKPNGVGSDCGGDQQGRKELHAAARLAHKQQLRGTGCRANSRSDSTLPPQWCRSPMQRIYGDLQRALVTSVTVTSAGNEA